MTRTGQWFLGVLSRTLEPSERDVVLGDLAETGDSFPIAMRGISGLAVRRQATLWMQWRSWLVLLGISGVAGYVLSRLACGLAQAFLIQFDTWRKFGVRFETGRPAGHDVVFLLCLSLALILCSWASGFILSSLSRRTLWLTFVALCLVAAFTAPLPLTSLLVAIPAFLGAMHSALSPRRSRLLAWTIVGITAVVVCMSGWDATVRDAGPVANLLLFLFPGWPAVYLLATARPNRKGMIS